MLITVIWKKIRANHRGHREERRLYPSGMISRYDICVTAMGFLDFS